MAGGFIGDFIKGSIPTEIEPELQAGVRLHRHIDSISNSLPEMQAGYCQFGAGLRRLARSYWT